MNYGFVIDNRKCIGCHACSVACKAENQVPVGANRTWVKYVEKGEFPDTRRLFQVTRCNHCANPPCVHICPVTALYQRKDGIVDFNQDLCIGCKACMQACPYDALYIHPDTGTAQKCHYCAHRVEQRLEPPCVVVCPEHAIISGDMDDATSEISQLLAREQTTVRKPEQGTKPKLFYIDGDAASLSPLIAPPESAYMWTSQPHEPEQGFFREPHRATREPRWTGPGAGSGSATASATPAVAFATPATSAFAPMTVPAATLLDIGDAIRLGHAPARRVTRGSRLRRTHDVSHEKPWGASVAAYIFTKSVAAGAFLLAIALPWLGVRGITADLELAAAIVSLVFLSITGVLLVADLERPERFLSVLLRPQWRSWLAIGAYIVTGYALLLTAWIGARLLDWTLVTRVLGPPGVVLAIAAAVYTAFLFAQAEGRDFWQSPALAPSLLLHAVAAGAAALLLLTLVLPAARPAVPLLARLLALALAADLFVILLGELYTPHASADAARAAKLIREGPYAGIFWVAVVGLGHAAAIAILLLSPASLAAVALASLLACLGMAAWCHCFVEAGQAVPLS